ncbi:UvrD-helicase domain-containing protein [Leuconostoc suionicum]|uniref:UvrD-helicase domain-containing protein n=1 Tax=Leuconostoc suionicum TaxID=1511761 RepID=UPI0024AD7F53|nr:UvrD-helicase domain-containing protein [Leuconostoc suionicum]MDI6502433.1 AAA family ATPase [Leuconostoc suionicum]
MKIKIAGAGAGKTTTMAEQIISKQRELPLDKMIYAITFTNNAVSCISEKLKNYYGVIPENIKVSTIHSFLYKEIINPYYYLLYGQQYEEISDIKLSSIPKYKRFKISELEKKGTLHVSVFTERAKWVIVKKSKDRKEHLEKRKTLLKTFTKYCGQIFIDEAQDIDRHMIDIIKAFNEASIPIELVGDPKQDLKGFGSLREVALQFPKQIEYINNCFRCPQKHLKISNILVADSEKQISNKVEGELEIKFESEINVRELICKEKYDLIYISKKNDKYETNKKRQNDVQMENLFYEIYQFLMICKKTQNKSNIFMKKTAYYFSTQLIKKFEITHNDTESMNEISKYFQIDTKSYAKIINALKINEYDVNNKIAVQSIDRVKGQEGENCLFILTKDLAPYLFGDKTADNKVKNKLYVALTRSLNKISILVSEEVESSYSKKFVLDYINSKI